MVRRIATIGILGLLVIGWVLFEVQNIWPFNADRITVLRLIFAVGAIATVAAFAFGRSRLLPPALIASTFLSTILYSNAAITVAYTVAAAVIVVLVAALGWVRRMLLHVS
jgi:hypothetical protein